jgi:hypothetical protein
LQTGCPSLALARAVGSRDQQKFEVRAQEPGAHLRCGGRDCDAAPVSATFKRAANPYLWMAGTALEVAAGMALFSQSDGSATPLLTIGAWTVLAVALSDVVGGYLGVVAGDEFQPTGGCCKLDQRTLVSWKGQRIALTNDDILDPTSKLRPLRYFSVQQALDKRAAAPSNYQKETTLASDAQGLLPRGTRLAVLDFKNQAKDMPLANVRYFSNLVRGAALTVSPVVDVMTEENLVALLQATGKDLASCEGECEVDTGRRIGADALVSGELLKLGDDYRLTLHLYDTRTGRLLGAQLASGKTIDEMDQASQEAAAALLREP